MEMAEVCTSAEAHNLIEIRTNFAQVRNLAEVHSGMAEVHLESAEVRG